MKTKTIIIGICILTLLILSGCKQEIPTIEYDINGNIIHLKNSTYEEWNRYENSNWIYSNNSKNQTWWTEYDNNSNVIHFRNSNGFESWAEYNEDNALIHYNNSIGFESWAEYDERGNRVYMKNNKGKRVYREFAENNSLIMEEYWEGAN